MARRTSRVRFVRPAPKTKIWIGAGTCATVLVGNTSQLITTLNAAALALRPFTILRTRQIMDLQSDQEAADESACVAIGEIVVTDQAVNIGITAMPDPSSVGGQPDADYFVWQGLMQAFNFSSSVGVQQIAENPIVVDSKAMRKVGPNQDIATVSSVNGDGCILRIIGRRLIQLH